ncbi:MAG: DedA family protein [Deltaproteobacteria bacterium]|nr:MAG: DedA family protein [Deltaproteobacteria bacterium]
MIEAIHAWVAGHGPLALVVLGVSAGIEYVFPPFPGDTVTLIGAVVAVSGEVHPLAVWGVVTAGSGAGMAANYLAGRWLRGHREWIFDRERRPWWMPITRRSLDRFEQRYRRFGPWLILANRFFPTFRAVLFVAAGLTGLSFARTFVLGLLSALAWNGLIIAAGYAVGANLEALEALLQRYNRGMWVLIGLVVAIGLLLWWRRRRRDVASEP